MNITRPYIPKFPLPEGYGSADDYLKALTLQGMHQRYPQNEEDYPIINEWRIEQELSVIREIGCADYFLILWDALQHARQKGILIGTGRGSAAGSVVNYCLGITQVDPLKYGLLFERFLNTNPSYYPFPDIYTDGDERLFDEMLCYLPHRYGRNCVARIANHLCGIVISSEDITKHFETTTYINRDGEEIPMIMAKAMDVEDAGFLKFDFLSLDALTVMRHTLNNIKLRCNQDINLLQIPLDDAATLQLYREGQTTSTFQFDCEGM